MTANRIGTRRRGFSLVELLVVMTGVAAALGLCIGLIHMLTRLDRASRAHLAETSALARLADQFRADVRASDADQFKTLEKSSVEGLDLALGGDRAVRDNARAGGVERIERRGDAVERRETYRLPGKGAPRLEVRCEEGDVWARLLLTAAPGPSRGVSIEALLGKDRRLAAEEAPSR